MATITAGMVAELRGKTDAPMMECKKALTEAEGDQGFGQRIRLAVDHDVAAGRGACGGWVSRLRSARGRLSRAP